MQSYWFLGIFFACTSEDPTSRPSAKIILEILDSHEIWHAPTDMWSQLGGQRGAAQKTLSLDESENGDTEEESDDSDSVIELSSDDENENEINHGESDDSSDIEILEEIPFTAGQKQKEVINGVKEASESKTDEPEVLDVGSGSTKEQKDLSSNHESEEEQPQPENAIHDNKGDEKTEIKESKNSSNDEESNDASDNSTS